MVDQRGEEGLKTPKDSSLGTNPLFFYLYRIQTQNDDPIDAGDTHYLGYSCDHAPPAFHARMDTDPGRVLASLLRVWDEVHPLVDEGGRAASCDGAFYRDQGRPFQEYHGVVRHRLPVPEESRRPLLCGNLGLPGDRIYGDEHPLLPLEL